MEPIIKIKDVRIEKNISQNYLAKEIGMSQGYLSEIENNKKSPTLKQLCRIAEVLEVHPCDLIIFL
jgi:transcriptional regulator with XRE-family HTH domain